MSPRRAAIWSLVIAAALAIPYYAVEIYDFWYAAPGQGGNGLMSEELSETPEQKLEAVLRHVAVMPIMIAVGALLLFGGVLTPIFLLARIVRYLLVPLLPPEDAGPDRRSRSDSVSRP